jgi:hypothetical protein
VTSDEIKEYTERAFNMDCPRMILRKNTGPTDRIYEGPGSVYQTAEGELMFKLYASGGRDHVLRQARSFPTTNISPLKLPR